jgi:hypothetical protein
VSCERVELVGLSKGEREHEGRVMRTVRYRRVTVPKEEETLTRDFDERLQLTHRERDRERKRKRPCEEGQDAGMVSRKSAQGWWL